MIIFGLAKIGHNYSNNAWNSQTWQCHSNTLITITNQWCNPLPLLFSGFYQGRWHLKTTFVWQTSVCISNYSFTPAAWQPTYFRLCLRSGKHWTIRIFWMVKGSYRGPMSPFCEDGSCCLRTRCRLYNHAFITFILWGVTGCMFVTCFNTCRHQGWWSEMLVLL